ncbi:MAG: hypothetical protein PW844_03115 [Pantoea sp.]|uniref:hypothetical protein n=1 Tax=Pantoea sp. TaxID=69393 RepID=UPI00239C6E7F|nr:hypothetical protein [Pantoea sp.]MDE1185463.1 hypothetical protein [Pantoea sp.]
MSGKPLTSQYLFRQTLRVPVLSSIYFGLFCWYGYTPQFDAQGFEHFLEISKLPIGIFSLTIPLVIIVNNMHRTTQIDLQIQEARNKNIVDSFYSQQKFAVEFFNNLPEQFIEVEVDAVRREIKKFKIDYSVHLYRMLFSESSPQKGASYEPNCSFINRLNENILLISESLTRLNSVNSDQLKEQARALIEIDSSLNEISKLLCIKWPVSMYYAFFKHRDFELSMRFLNNEELADTIIALYSFTIDILEFSGPLDFNKIIAAPRNEIELSSEYLRKNSPAIFTYLTLVEGYIGQCEIFHL